MCQPPDRAPRCASAETNEVRPAHDGVGGRRTLVKTLGLRRKSTTPPLLWEAAIRSLQKNGRRRRGGGDGWWKQVAVSQIARRARTVRHSRRQHRACSDWPAGSRIGRHGRGAGERRRLGAQPGPSSRVSRVARLRGRGDTSQESTNRFAQTCQVRRLFPARQAAEQAWQVCR